MRPLSVLMCVAMLSGCGSKASKDDGSSESSESKPEKKKKKSDKEKPAKSAAASSAARPGPTPPRPSAATVDGACTALATATCAKYASCDHGYKLKLGYVDDATCQASVKAGCLDAVHAPDAIATAAEISACAEATSTSVCDELGHVPACRFKGKRAAEAACSVDAQCDSGVCERKSDTSACGKCLKGFSVGDACSETEVSDCKPDLACIKGKCAVRLAIGSACANPRSCQFGASCANGKCISPKEGDACDVSPQSDKQTFCHYAYGCEGNKCIPRRLAAVGETCGAGQGPFCTRSTCDLKSMKCQPLPGDGEACDAATECAAPLRCLDKRCGMPGKNVCQ